MQQYPGYYCLSSRETGQVGAGPCAEWKRRRALLGGTHAHHTASFLIGSCLLWPWIHSDPVSQVRCLNPLQLETRFGRLNILGIRIGGGGLWALKGLNLVRLEASAAFVYVPARLDRLRAGGSYQNTW